jgi:Polysaccharide deacetylase
VSGEHSANGRPEALIVSQGRFYSLPKPGSVDPSANAKVDGSTYEQPEPPSEVPDPWPKADGSRPEPVETKARVFLTVDTEDDYFETPHMITGEGLGEEYGAYGILDILERHGLRATFFVNVYEAHRHEDPQVMERLVKAIHERGHEVALHTHPSEDLDFYSRPLYWFNVEEQTRILSYGAELIEKWTGTYPITFRAGGYVLNDETFEALEGLGFRIDSSVFFRSDKNRITPFTVNAVRMRSKLIEVPVTYVPRVLDDGTIEHRKFDVNWLSQDELDNVVDRVRRFEIGEAMFMMHSFSFIDKASIRQEKRGSPIARYRSRPVRSRYVEIYGTHPVLRDKFDRFAENLANDPRVEVRTLADAEEALSQRARTGHPDIVPVV